MKRPNVAGCLAFDFLPLPFRPPKPRESGVTMVLDKGLTLTETHEFARMAGPYVDIVKLGWGTARLLDRALVVEKVSAYRAHDIRVSPGGTFLEVAVAHGLEQPFLDEARALGFECVEVSDGVLRMNGKKLDLITRACEMGFRVISEVGRKSAVDDARMQVAERIAQTRDELRCGAWKVIMEGRESGTVGVFTPEGGIKAEMVGEIVGAVGLHAIIFEAPNRSQQAWFISNCGDDVNLGNIAPAEVISVETLRTGLRADTLLQHHVDPTTITIELGPEGALAAAHRGDVIVVIDALRAASTIVTALAHGVGAVVSVTSIDECVGELTAGERGGKKISGLTHDNSPVAFATPAYAGKTLVLTTTNGSECLRAAASVSGTTVLVGALLNARAVARHAYRLARDRAQHITLLVAGRNNRPAIEDLIVVTEIAAYLPTCRVAGVLELVYSDDYPRGFLESESGANLVALGKREDVLFCARKDQYDVVPVWTDGRLVAAGNAIPVAVQAGATRAHETVRSQ